MYDEKSQKFVKATWQRTLGHLRNFIVYVVCTGLLQSCFTLFSFFPSLGGGTPSHWFDWREIWNPFMWKSTILYAILFQFYLATYGEGLVFLTTLITRRQCNSFMDNPMFASNSPSEFWGRRWNSIIHYCLKNGVYKPVRKMGASKELSVVAAFLASGLFHEWILPVVFADTPSLRIGTTSLFFLWQGVVISLEYTVGHWPWVAKMVQLLPGPVRTSLVILMGVPLGHWFCDGFVHTNFFEHGHISLVAILPVDR